MNKESFGEEPQVEEDTKNIELPPEVKEAVEIVAERTAGLVEGETDVAIEVSENKPPERKSSVRKITRMFTLITLLMMGAGANKAESQDSWGGERTTGGVDYTDIGVRIGGEIVRSRLEQSARKDQEKMRELENELPKLKEELKAKREQLIAFRAQEKAGADMTEWIEKMMAEIDSLEEDIVGKEKDLEDLRNGNLLRKGTGVIVDEITNRGPSGWGGRRGFWGRK